MVLWMTSSGFKVRGCLSSVRGWVLKKEKKPPNLYMYCISYMEYILYISYMHTIYLIYCGTHVTDVVTDNIVWIQSTRMSWFNTWLGPEKEETNNLYMYYISYM